MVAHAMPSYGNCINRVCIKLMPAHGSNSHCLRLLKHDQMIVDANVSDDELGRTQSHRDHYGAPVASRDSQRSGMVWRRVPHHLAIHILHAWSLLGAALQSCALDAVYVSELHVHACCTPSRAARAKEMLMEVETSRAEHEAVASASPRDGSCQLQVHLLIARHAARSDLTVRSDCAVRRHIPGAALPADASTPQTRNGPEAPNVYIYEDENDASSAEGARGAARNNSAHNPILVQLPTRRARRAPVPHAACFCSK